MHVIIPCHYPVITCHRYHVIIPCHIPCHYLSQIPFVEDIVLGTEGLKEGGAGDFSVWIKDKRFDLGDVPLRIGGKLMTTYNY